MLEVSVAIFTLTFAATLFLHCPLYVSSDVEEGLSNAVKVAL